MALRTFNSVGGFSVGENSQQIISQGGDITAANIASTNTVSAPIFEGVIGVGSSNQPNIHTVGNLTNLTVAGTLVTPNAIIANLSVVNADISGVLTGIDLVNSDVANIALVNANNISVSDTITTQTLHVTGVSTLGNLIVNGDTISGANVKIGALTMPQVDGVANSVMTSDGAGNITLKTLVQAGISGNTIQLGNPTTGNLINNNPAITTWTNTTYVTDAVDRLNEVLGKLVPPQPPVFPNNTTLAIQTMAPAGNVRVSSFTQTNNTTTGSKQATAGATIANYKRVAAYDTNTLNDVGPGDSGTVTVVKNSAVVGTKTIVEGTGNNGTVGELIISDNSDYGTKTGTALLFWYSYDAKASGTVTEGWNEVYLNNTSGSSTNAALWYYDASTPGTPVITQTSFVAPASTGSHITYSSGIPHYNSTAQFTFTGTVNRLSGDMYPLSDTFLTGTAGGMFQAPVSLTYATAGITTPLTRNLYVASGSATITTTVNVSANTGSSAVGPSLSAINSYATGSLTITPGATILSYASGATATPNENNIPVGVTAGTGATLATRTGGLAGTDTPATSGASVWTSSSALGSTDATVVGGAIKQDKTNYSTGYLPVGPDLSAQAATQYITFRFNRTAVSKFDISLTGKISGCWVAIPGSTLDTTAAGTNGWIDMSVAYAGAGKPGNGTGGNGSNGCALAGTMTLNTLTTQSKTCTFGTESSTNSTGNYIYVRFKLATGDSITALSFPNPTH